MLDDILDREVDALIQTGPAHFVGAVFSEDGEVWDQCLDERHLDQVAANLRRAAKAWLLCAYRRLLEAEAAEVIA